MIYYRPLVQTGTPRLQGALPLAGGPHWFTHVVQIQRHKDDHIIPASRIPPDIAERLNAPRAAIAGLKFDTPQIMGILNATPDSFSDGGQNNSADTGLNAALTMIADGAHILDIGGESTRPGADFIPPDQEIDRVTPIISAIRAQSDIPISIDTRKAAVARAALDAGAGLVNDVAGFTFDADLAPMVAQRQVPVCIMHAQGDPKTMQDSPQYDDVLLDVYDFLERQIAQLTQLGLPRAQMIVDPGIGFGKTMDQNLTLLRHISLFHGLGCPILLGVSRKGFIGRIGLADNPTDRAPGSIAVALAALAQGVQILRVHDVAQTAQALRLWQEVQ